MRHPWSKALLAAAVASTLPSTALGLEYILDAGLRAEYSDNIRLAATNEEAGWLGVLSGGYRMIEDSEDLKANITATVEYEDYLEDQFEDRTNFGFIGNVVWAVSPERFTWTVEDVFTQVLRDSRLLDVPDNLEDTNAFSTGPDLFLHINPVHTIDLGARYGNYYLERANPTDVNTGNERYSLIARWIHRYTMRTTVSLNAIGEKVVFKDDFNNENFSRRDAFFNIQSRTTQAGSGYSLDLGNTFVRRERSGDVEGFLGRLNINRQITAKSVLRLGASGELTDTARDIQSLALTGSDPTRVGQPGQTDIVYVKQVDLAYTGSGGFSGIVVRVYGRDENYEIEPDDQRGAGSSVELSYKFGPTLTASLTGNWAKGVFLDEDRVDRNASGGLGFAYRARDPLTVSLTFTRNERVSDGADRGEEYEEFRAVLGLSYRYQTPASRLWE